MVLVLGMPFLPHGNISRHPTQSFSPRPLRSSLPQILAGVRYKLSDQLLAVMEREEAKKKHGGADYPLLVDIAVLVQVCTGPQRWELARKNPCSCLEAATWGDATGLVGGPTSGYRTRRPWDHKDTPLVSPQPFPPPDTPQPPVHGRSQPAHVIVHQPHVPMHESTHPAPARCTGPHAITSPCSIPPHYPP